MLRRSYISDLVLRYSGILKLRPQTLIQRWCSNSNDSGNISQRYRDLMGSVPQSVVVVTTAHRENDKVQKRGITCSSFTSISMNPPIASFAINMPSRMNSLLLQTDKFAIHVLAKNQVKYAQHFAKPTDLDKDQFADIPHELNEKDLPILRDTCGVLVCNTHSVNQIGDHSVWYGNVTHAYKNGLVMEPMLYYHRSFRAIGDDTFIQAFEDTTLPFEDWTHEAHIRMAWNYIRENGLKEATPLIKNGILKYNEQNKDKINRGYHETVTMFYIHVVADALAKCPEPDTFEEFLEKNSYLLRPNLLFNYYSDEAINKKEAKIQFLPPDKKRLPLAD